MPASRHALPARPGGVHPAIAYSGPILVGATALAVLAFYQHLLLIEPARQNPGSPVMPTWLAYISAIGMDWGAVVAGFFWFAGTGEVRRWGRATAIILLVGSTAATVVAFAIFYGPQWAWLGAIHPVVSWLMSKLLTVWQAQRSHAGDVLAEAAAQVAAADLERDRAAEQHQAELDELRGQIEALQEQLAAAPRHGLRLAPVPVVPESAEVRAQHDAPTGPVPVVTADGVPTVEQVADWIRARRTATPAEPDGQRPAATAFGVSRTKLADVHRAAQALVDAETPAGDVPADEPVTAAAGG